MLKLAFSLILIPSLAVADCGMNDVLAKLKPRAEWALYGASYDGLVWLDKTQSKPTRAQVNTAISACVAQEVANTTAREDARTVLKSTAATDTQKLNALIKILGEE